MDRWGASIFKPTHTPELKQRMKNVFVLYLWDMFYGPEAITNHETIYVRNAVWYYRDLFFRNRAVFHWMISTLFQPLWNLNIEGGEMLRLRLRDFFRMTMLCFILEFSPQDLARMRREHHPDRRISSIIVKNLSSSVVEYFNRNVDMPETGRSHLETYFVFACRQRWQDYRPHQEEIHESFRVPMLPPDITARILREADHTDQIWTPPQSKDEVVEYIEGLNGWNEF